MNIGFATTHKSTSRWLGRTFALGAVMALGASTLSASVVAATASTISKAKSCRTANGIKVTNPAVCRGLAFYKGQTITFITGSAGGGTGLPAVALAPLLAKYLGASAANVSYQGQANGIPGQDALAAASPTGLELGFVNAGSIASLMLTHQPGFNFNPERLSYISGQLSTPAVLAASATSGFNSFAAMKKAAAASPSAVKILAEFPSAGSSGLEVLLNMLGIHATYVTGYASTSAVKAGFQRGDGPIANAPFSDFESFIQAKTSIPLASSVALSPGMLLRGLLVNTPTYASLLKTYGPKKPTKAWNTAVAAEDDFVKLGQPIVAQTKVAVYKLDALRAAVKWAWSQSSFVSVDLAAGNNPTYVSPATAKADFTKVVAAGTALTKYLSETTP